MSRSGGAENGLTPVALAPVALMAAWLAASTRTSIVPRALLLLPPDEGLVARAALPIIAGLRAAFSVEPELAALLAGDAPVADGRRGRVRGGAGGGAGRRRSLNLRQGAFARRRQWKVDSGRLRRIALLARGAGGADAWSCSSRRSCATPSPPTGWRPRRRRSAARAAPAARPAFGALAAILFEAVRATPNAELGRLEYRARRQPRRDRPWSTARRRSPPSASAPRRAGCAVEGGALTNAGGRPSAELVLRPA